MGLCDHSFGEQNNEILDLLNEESISGARSGCKFDKKSTPSEGESTAKVSFKLWGGGGGGVIYI